MTGPHVLESSSPLKDSTQKKPYGILWYIWEFFSLTQSPGTPTTYLTTFVLALKGCFIITNLFLLFLLKTLGDKQSDKRISFLKISFLLAKGLKIGFIYLVSWMKAFWVKNILGDSKYSLKTEMKTTEPARNFKDLIIIEKLIKLNML